MRPLELRLRNFRSYFGEAVSFDFRGRGLVGIVGPIGSGKSSLLDAISFALYGKTPAGGAGTKALIHQRASDGGALLRFEVDGEIWEAVRSLRRKGASQHALYRYDVDTPDAEPVEKIVLEAEVNQKIVSLLGLDYDAFGRSVLLAQGRFAEFLRSRPGERDAVLKGVFGHDRIDAMRSIAKLRAAEVAAELGKVEVRTEQLETVAQRLAETRTELAAAEDRVEQLRKAERALADLDARIAAAGTSHRSAGEQLEELSRHAGRLPDPATAARLIATASESDERRRVLAEELEVAQAEAAEAEEALAEAQAAGEPTRLEDAARLVTVADPQRRSATEAARRRETLERRRDEAQARCAAASTALAEAEAAATEATTLLETAATRADESERTLHAAHQGNMAAVLRGELAAGSPCPVCEQTVAEVPPAASSVDVEAAEADHRTAREARQEAEERRGAAMADVAAARQAMVAAESTAESLDGELEQAIKAEEEARHEVAATTAQLEELLGPGDPAELLARRREAHTALGDAVAEARRRVEQVRRSHDRVIVDAQEVGKQVSALRVELADLSGRLGISAEVPSDSVDALGGAVQRLHEAWREATSSLESAASDALRDGKQATTERSEQLAALEVTGDFAAALGAADERVAQLGAVVGRDAAEVAAGDELLATRDRLAAEHARFQQIAGDLTDARFVRFLLDEERSRLADLGSDHFQRLSSGRYRFTEDGTFSIVDLTAAEAERKASTLSGGETFLASLALALALAEMVARTGGRLDAFFLDEGFGSLDPEHLDLAMDGIEALVADGSSRLVVVVSHVPELQHRIEDLIQLDRDPLTGDTRILHS